MQNTATISLHESARITHKLQAAGMPHQQAECIASILLETTPPGDILTRHTLKQELDEHNLVSREEFKDSHAQHLELENSTNRRFIITEIKMGNCVTHKDILENFMLKMKLVLLCSTSIAVMIIIDELLTR